MTPKFLALDLETTGLSETRDHILEIAYVVLTDDLTEVARHSATIGVPEDHVRERCSDYALEMHRGTGLLEGYAVTGERSWLASEEGLLIKVCGYFPEKPILLGNSIQFDRKFISHQMRGVEPLLHHRMLDARSIRLAFPDLYFPDRTPEHTQHRALGDALYSAECVRHFRRVLTEMDKALDAKKAWTKTAWTARYGDEK